MRKGIVMENITGLTMVSFNLWADPFLKKERFEWLCKNILEEKPDILLFQEASNGIIVELATCLRSFNYHFKVANERRQKYEVIASKWPIANHNFKRYSNSVTDRGLLWATLQVKNVEIIVASTQLEQKDDYTPKRVGQMNCILNFLNSLNENVILGYDTGFKNDEHYEIDDKGWLDAWYIAGRNKLEQYTLDSNLNKNFTKPSKSRPDRIYYRGNFKEPNYNLIGTIPSCGKPAVNPSTHFGIKLNIALLH